jgi:hypothetical protein
MAERRDALTELVQQHVGTHVGRRWTVAAFAERAVDPDTSYRPSTGLIGNIIQGKNYKITPELVGALAAGLELPRDVVAAAAHFQLIGYDTAELKGGAPATLIRTIGEQPGDAERAIAERWATEEEARTRR